MLFLFLFCFVVVVVFFCFFLQISNDNFQKSYGKAIPFHNGFLVFLSGFIKIQIFFDLHTFDNKTLAIFFFF